MPVDPTHRRISSLVLLTLAAWYGCGRWSHSQEPVVTPHIDVAERYAVGEKMVATCVVAGPAGSSVAYEWGSDDKTSLETVDGGQRAFLWAPPGSHTLTVQATYSLAVFTPDPESPSDPTKAKLTTLKIPLPVLTETFLVGDAPPVPPPDPDDPKPDPTTKATAATYVYEKGQAGIPPAVLAGLNRLNRERKIVATLYEQDSTDGDDDVPDQYKVPLAAARNAGLPALVVTAGSEVLKVLKDPRTDQQVFEAIAP